MSGFPELYAVGMVFLSQDSRKASEARSVLEQELSDQGLKVAGWRTVPVDQKYLGPIALEQLPVIEQVFVTPGKDLDQHQFEAALFMSHRKASQELADDPDFYICSLSSKVITYKGLMMPADLASFYPDLGDSRFETAICVFHQRFST